MGIGPEPEAMLRGLPLPQGFTVIELGDQIWHQGKRRSPEWWSRPARELYEAMGCTEYEAIDGNGGGTMLLDLNLPLHHLRRQFDLVTDFGTSEHVFDVGQVWRTIHQLLKPGGLVAFDKPGQGFPEHGFYNFHETFFRDFARANGYRIGALYAVEAPRGTCWRGWMQKPAEERAFNTPQQGKYKRRLKI